MPSAPPTLDAAERTWPGPAVAMVDLGAIPPGLLTLDALIKEAEIQVVSAGTVQPGRYLILFGGEVEPVERSLRRAEATAGRALLDSVLLPHAEPRILPAIGAAQRLWPAEGDTAGVVQTGTTPTLLAAVDASLKGALVELVELRIADGLGGQGVATFWGQTHDVEAALELAELAIGRGRSEGSWTTIIRNADPEVARGLGAPSRFFEEWRG